MEVEKKSRILVRALRHDPSILGIELDKKGWANVSDVLNNLGIDRSCLDIIVATNNKKRFEYNEKRDKIRASQGHSINNIEVYKDWSVYIPHANLYHGTSIGSVDSILKDKLISKTRTHVHLSKDVETAYNVGKRHGKPIILSVDAPSMYKDGYKFYESSNGVILTDFVPSKYLSIYKNNEISLIKEN